MSDENKPFAVVVEAEINPEKMDEFLEIMKTNSENSRKEPDCLRFDVLQAQDNPNKFFFYEVYKSVDSVAYHKEQDHYKAWANFKDGGVIKSVSHKVDGLFMTD